MISVGDVIWLYDGNIRPPGDKMCVCLCAVEGFYFRINTDGWRSGSVPISSATHKFLSHDSHIECSGPIEMDDMEVEESIRVNGIIGQIEKTTIKNVIDSVSSSKTIKPNDIKTIVDNLTELMAD